MKPPTERTTMAFGKYAELLKTGEPLPILWVFKVNAAWLNSTEETIRTELYYAHRQQNILVKFPNQFYAFCDFEGSSAQETIQITTLRTTWSTHGDLVVGFDREHVMHVGAGRLKLHIDSLITNLETFELG